MTTTILYCECETPVMDVEHDAGCRRCGRPVDFSPKYPNVGTRRGWFVDTDSTQVARGRVALFYGFTRADGTPDRTMSAHLVGVAETVEELARRYPEAFEQLRVGMRFDTPFEQGCIVQTVPDPLGNFDALDSDGVLCGFHVDMVERVTS